MSPDEEFVKFLPRCDGCDEVFPVGVGPMGTVGVVRDVKHLGRVVRRESFLYCLACAPQTADGTPYPAGHTTYAGA